MYYLRQGAYRELEKKHLDLLFDSSQDKAIAFDMDISECCIRIAVNPWKWTKPQLQLTNV